MDMRKAFLRQLEFTNFRYSMAVDFGHLAMEAGSGPSRDVGAKGWPHELVRDHLSRSFNAGMSKAVDGVENSSSP